jgi:hypothetical protein
MRQLLSVLLISSACSLAWAQHDHAAHAEHTGHDHHSDYVHMTDRDIKALSPQQVEELLNGKGMGLSLPAELNHTPGPLHLLQLRDALALSEDQAQKLETVVKSMKADSIDLGKSIVDAERQLDLSFKNHTASAASIDAQTQRIAVLMGKLRAVHLKAHLQAAALLTPKQIADYDRERGYAQASADQTRATP